MLQSNYSGTDDKGKLHLDLASTEPEKGGNQIPIVSLFEPSISNMSSYPKPQ
jgi:hypothetical protein